MAASPRTKARQRSESFMEALTLFEAARARLDHIALHDLRQGIGWRPIVDAMIDLDVAIATLRFALNVPA